VLQKVRGGEIEKKYKNDEVLRNEIFKGVG